jgi:hypothetical protein
MLSPFNKIFDCSLENCLSMRSKYFRLSLLCYLIVFSAKGTTVDTVDVESKAMNRMLKTAVVLPDSYKRATKAFPVLYLLHGARAAFVTGSHCRQISCCSINWLTNTTWRSFRCCYRGRTKFRWRLTVSATQLARGCGWKLLLQTS